MSSRKRKKYTKDIQCVFFPDDVGTGVQKVGIEPSSLSSVCSAKSWEKCGDSFVDTPVIKNLKSSGRKLSAVRKLAQTPALVQTSANEDPVHIAWSSSDSEQSDNETQEQHLSRSVQPQQQRPHKQGRPTAPIRSYTRELHTHSADKDDLPIIDTDSDLDQSEEDVEKDSGQQISDCESESFDEKPKDLNPLKPTNATELEISGYVSDGENIGDTMTPSRPDSESFPLQTGEGSRRSVSDWVRSAQAMLQTPQKAPDQQPKTPEDSAKKKRKFQSGGLAERLNRLQCRQRSAISFWRHQSISDTSTATTVDRPGVLALEVLEVQKECSMQLARCEHHQPPGDGHQHIDPASGERARAHVLVLFNRDTAAQLIPAPRDIIHIYPPWQSLSIEGFSCDIILNTHFSQKVFSASKPSDASSSRNPLSAERCAPYCLGKIFGLLEACRTASENDAKQGAVPNALCNFGGPGGLTKHCLSLLEAIEGLGQAGSVGQDVEVVVQRVFSVPLPDCSAVSVLKPRVPSRSSSAPPPAEKGNTRLCVLVQDSYGMFSVVQLHLLPHKDDLLQYCQKWQGKTCVLRDIKVVRRVTRERSTRLFSLIDSLWPPAMPLRDHGNAQSTSNHVGSVESEAFRTRQPSRQQASVPPCRLLLLYRCRLSSVTMMFICDKAPPPPFCLHTVDTERRGGITVKCSCLKQESRAAGPALSFCYLLSGQESSVEPSEGQTVSTLYVPPTGRTLRDILQSERKTCRCSFVATVIYKRMQSSDVGQGEVWLVLTDPSLQEEQPERPCRRTVALCVSTSCVLTSSVLEALHSSAACCVLFRDAIKEHGVLLCAEQSVVEVQSTTRPESLSQSLTDPQAKTLPQPVILDLLSLETTPNSLCTLTGVIVGVDENTAYSWPACSHCGSDNLEKLAERPQNFHCASCKSAVDRPDTKIQLEVFLSSSSLNNCTLKVKLQKKTIMSVLNVASLEFNEFPGYDVENVLGKEVGPLAVYVRVVTRKPALWIGLEEICL
ncbi:DNA repair-scaffolding protein isoform X1 [Lates calcarifer]|uniref:DNA repair-scaffolding protein isoform X1 n=1 Tax=Lates calcarifer TaxID=8187 RepID=A0A4W6CIW2_LATCA|nr:DNA repair-scaffolding protein isoform X1 [Lates calcarifer]